ncbi:homogentisate 1,2-dioxygenase [Ascodesmis nigricans]|uniref:homogentisate 1,2-dioxygenase n=1 Tax=Ascodesmis nigricans TaxID=341454 RepID=A0A4S2MQX2_9PEZI|nr:homogentisate 1,2-dioxygenase [Ascodesmis nigricans]
MAAPVTTSVFEQAEKYEYMNGFPGSHESECLPNALPIGRNSPQMPPYGLYAEKLSGSAFTSPRKENKQSWLYRIMPSASHSPFTPLPDSQQRPTPSYRHLPNQLRWSPLPFPSEPTCFLRGVHALAGTGSPTLKNGLEISIFSLTASMDPNTAFYSADGDYLLVPQDGDLDITTEFGALHVRPLEIAVIPRGIRFRIDLPQGRARGYMLETFNPGHFELPELGPIGSNGLANSRDFQVPKARYVDCTAPHRVVAKQNRIYYVAEQNHSPFDVVAWHGNYYPMKYDLGRFNTIGTISYDHPDPSIFTVLTLPSAVPGTAVADFVIFPPRWLVGQNTFRPPWYHRNCMSEFMGLISGGYDAKTGGGFVPGGASLHNVMAGHGPDGVTAKKASEGEQKPELVGKGSMAFMFESSLDVGATEGRGMEVVQEEYVRESWGGVERRVPRR